MRVWLTLALLSLAPGCAGDHTPLSEGDGGLPVRVTVVEELGADAFVYGTSGVEGTPNNIIVRVSARDSVRKGETIHVTTDPRNVHVFDTDTGERLSD